jgi:hypothetical protein
MKTQKWRFNIKMKPIFEDALKMATDRTGLTNTSITITEDNNRLIMSVEPTEETFLTDFFFCAGILYERNNKAPYSRKI